MSATLSHSPAPRLPFLAGGGLRSLLQWYEPWRISRSGLALVIVAHLLLLWGLIQPRSLSLPPQHNRAPVLNVSLISPQVQVAPPVDTPPPPKVVEPDRPKRPQQLLASKAPPTPDSPQLAAQPEEPLEQPPAPPVAQSPTNAPPETAAAPQPPRFDAAYLDNPSPIYPRISRRMGEQGKTLLIVQVSADGKPLKVSLHQSSGSSRLDQAAIEAVQRWRFVPARQGSSPIAASVIVPIIFSLQN